MPAWYHLVVFVLLTLTVAALIAVIVIDYRDRRRIIDDVRDRGRKEGVWRVQRTVEVYGLTTAERQELEKILVGQGIEAVQLRIDEMKKQKEFDRENG